MNRTPKHVKRTVLNTPEVYVQDEEEDEDAPVKKMSPPAVLYCTGDEAVTNVVVVQE